MKMKNTTITIVSLCTLLLLSFAATAYVVLGPNPLGERLSVITTERDSLKTELEAAKVEASAKVSQAIVQLETVNSRNQILQKEVEEWKRQAKANPFEFASLASEFSNAEEFLKALGEAKSLNHKKDIVIQNKDNELETAHSTIATLEKRVSELATFGISQPGLQAAVDTTNQLNQELQDINSRIQQQLVDETQARVEAQRKLAEAERTIKEYKDRDAGKEAVAKASYGNLTTMTTSMIVRGQLYQPVTMPAPRHHTLRRDVEFTVGTGVFQFNGKYYIPTNYSCQDTKGKPFMIESLIPRCPGDTFTRSQGEVFNEVTAGLPAETNGYSVWRSVSGW